MSRPIQPSGRRVPNWRTSPPARVADLAPGPSGDVGRQVDRACRCRAAAGRCRPGRARSSESPIECPCAARKVKHMPPPMTSASATSSRASMTPSLSLTLAPPRTATNGRRGWSRSAEEHLDLLRQQPTRRAGQGLRRADDRGVGPVRRAEGVVDVGVLALDQPRDERRVVALLARVEAQVLEQLDAGRQLGQRARTGSIEYCRVGLALGPAEVAARRDRARRALTSHSIVGSAARMRRSSVISPSSSGTLKSARTQHPLARRRRRRSSRRGSFESVGASAGSQRRRSSARSTRRFE